MLKKAERYFALSICFIFASSLQIVFVPLVMYGVSIERSVISFLISVCLWLFLIAGYICLLKTKTYCRITQRADGFGRFSKNKNNVGLLNFNSNVEANMFDVMAILSLIATIATSVFWNEVRFAVSISVALFVFTFQMRCILNGRIYIDLKTIESRRSKNE